MVNDRGVRYRDLKRGPGETRNLAGLVFFDVDEISVNEYHPLPDGQGAPTQVHVMVKLADVEHPLVMRFKGPETLDQVIVALISHRKRVWPAAHELRPKEREA